MRTEDTSAPSAREDETGPCDPRALARLRKWGGEKLVRDLIRIFVAQVPERLSTARRGLQAGDPSAAERAAHALKSSSAQLGAVRMAALCERIESIAAGGELGSLPALLDGLEREFAEYTHSIASQIPQAEPEA